MNSIMMRLFALLALMYAVTSQDTSHFGALLKITRPSSLVEKLDAATNLENGRVEGRPALFGSPPYNNRMKGRLVYPVEQGNQEGCNEFTPEMLPDWMRDLDENGNPSYAFPPIFIMDRGDCYFKDKVKHAQDAGAVAAIISDSRSEVYLPYMAGHDPTVRIPSILIHKAHGKVMEDFFRDPANENVTVLVEMLWSLPRPDNRVEWDMWSLSFEPTTIEFKSVMRQINTALSEHAFFTMHYHTIAGHSYGCDGQTQPCGDQCTNHGRYCEEDPEHDFSLGKTGADVVLENLRQKCVWVYDNATSSLATHSRLFFEYVDLFNQECVVKKNRFNAECSESVQRSVGGPALVNAVKACVADRDPSQDQAVDFWDEDMHRRQQLSVLPSIPTIVINEVPYRGSLLKCSFPINVQTCPVFASICAGFLPGTEPDACLGHVCKNGEDLDNCGVCGGDGSSCAPDSLGSKQDQPDSGLSGGVIALIVAASILLALGSAAGCFIVLKKQRDSERRLDDFMASYRPLEAESGAHGGLMTGHSSSTAGDL